MAALIDGWKNRGLTPERRFRRAKRRLCLRQGPKLYAAYQERLKILNAADFGDLLLETLHILRAHPDILADYRDRFRYMLVDEYQDTNVVQYLWLKLLAQARARNVCVVGDDDQSIYGWRGAEVENILRFERDFPGAKVIRLERNYRSTGHILGAASGLIAANKGRLGKTLWTEGDAGREDHGAAACGTPRKKPATSPSEAEDLQPPGQPAAQRDGDPGARLVPDARIRRPLHLAGPALSRDRRPALL